MSPPGEFCGAKNTITDGGSTSTLEIYISLQLLCWLCGATFPFIRFHVSTSRRYTDVRKGASLKVWVASIKSVLQLWPGKQLVHQQERLVGANSQRLPSTNGSHLCPDGPLGTQLCCGPTIPMSPICALMGWTHGTTRADADEPQMAALDLAWPMPQNESFLMRSFGRLVDFGHSVSVSFAPRLVITGVGTGRVLKIS